MSFFNWLFRTPIGHEDWRELTQADVKQATDELKYWQEQQKLAVQYVKAKGTMWEAQALSKAAFKLLPVAMSLEPLVTIQINLLVLLAVACLAAIARKWLRFPYSVVLVLVGIGAGWFGQTDAGREFLQPLTLSHDLILFVFVPPLVFESALNLDSRLLFRNLPPILTLAGPGLLLSTAIVGGILSWGTPLALPQALLFGSLISATDPVAVIALFKELGAPQRLGVLIEGESLFNDATAIVAFNIILAAIATGQGFGSAME